MDNQQNADGHKDQQHGKGNHMGEGLNRSFPLAEKDQRKEKGDDGDYAQDDAEGKPLIEAGAELLAAVLRHAVHTISSLKLFLFQVLKPTALEARGDEQSHGSAH